MDLTEKIKSLSEIEKKTLKVLSKDYKKLEEIRKEARINIDSVRRAVNWLSQKGLAKIDESSSKIHSLTSEGKKALEKGLPERRMLRFLEEKGSADLSDSVKLQKQLEMTSQEFNIALGLNKRKQFVAIIKKLELTEVGKEYLKDETSEEKTLKEVSQGKKPSDEKALKETIMRGLVNEKIGTVRNVSITIEGDLALKSKEFSQARSYNIHEKVPELFIGKRQPYIQFLNSIRKKLVALGFKEMPERLINQEFYNFDVLFQPQDHPARTWTDTYQLKKPARGKLPHHERVKAIKDAHEHGGKTISRGWGYNWSEEIASKLMPTAHGTAADARQMIEGVEYPRKYFVINRCFRPDVLDATHLIEFNQLDGFIVGEGLSFRSLLGVLKDFAIEIAGAKDVKFFPDYYPFTEPSVQLSAKHPKMGWVEFAGAGIFRPEITESLGIKEPVLAWGMGVDRLAMFKLGINDIRHLFSDDLTWLRKSKMVIE